jgi:virginiamycin B lyase
MRRYALPAACVAACLTACSSPSQPQNGMLPGLNVSSARMFAPQAAMANGTGTLVIRVTDDRTRMRPQYLGPTTKGMTVDITGPTTLKETVGLTIGATGCHSKLMTLQCTLKVTLKACPTKKKCYTGTVATYDAFAGGKIPPGAHELSADQKFRFAIGATPTIIPLVLYGIPASVTLTPGSTSTLLGTQASGFVFPKCGAIAQDVSLIAADADGNYIVGVGAPRLSLASNNTAQISVSAGSSSSAFVLSPPTYAGGYPHGGTTIQLTATAATPKAAGHHTASTPIDVTYSTGICGIITEFGPVPSGVSAEVAGITAGPDGNMWFAEAAADKIGRITTAGAITEFTGLTPSALPALITVGPDHNLWFTECVASNIGKITTAGAVTEYPTKTAHARPIGIAAGPDGNMWFTEGSANNIGVSTLTGTVTEYTVPTSSASVEGITAGPDNALWFTETGGNKIGEITTIGGISEFDVPTASSEPVSVVTGSDGELYFTEEAGNAIGRLQASLTSTTFNSAFPLPETGSDPAFPALGPDGNVWFPEIAGNRIASITPGGKITEYAVPTGSADPFDVAPGPDGAIWFTELLTGKIGRLW